ncbi:hypothetical protein BHE74_00001384 [Ensete ventricosum]|nr:hypothetical protein BHE74_00001384 [Ensete ventricosum]
MRVRTSQAHAFLMCLSTKRKDPAALYVTKQHTVSSACERHNPRSNRSWAPRGAVPCRADVDSINKKWTDWIVTRLATSLHLLHPLRAPTGKIDSKTRVGEDERDDNMPLHECNGLEFPTHNPVMGNHHKRNNSPSDSVSSRSSSVNSTSRSFTDGEREEQHPEAGGEGNGVLDDWEAVADALSGDVGRDDRHHPDPVVTYIVPAASSSILGEAPLGGSTMKLKPVRSTQRAWRPDDTSRPQSLPSISKKCIFPWKAGRDHLVSRQSSILSLPSCCPICYEDLDLTDSSFLPCSCGFRLCLFCHKRILEADGRCPGCRKQYDSMSSGGVEYGRNTTSIIPVVPFV